MKKNFSQLENNLNEIINKYSDSFSIKEYGEENEDYDLLMEIFDITPSLKRENRQFWGRELGMCWQRIVTETFKIAASSDFKSPTKIGKDEPYDLQFKNFAIDTKYRVGSGDAGTLKKFKKYGQLLLKMNLIPTQLILRNDNLPAAVTAIRSGGWDIKFGQDVFDWIKENTSGFELDKWLKKNKNNFRFSSGN
jgi:hypothetical protein